MERASNLLKAVGQVMSFPQQPDNRDLSVPGIARQPYGPSPLFHLGYGNTRGEI